MKQSTSTFAAFVFSLLVFGSAFTNLPSTPKAKPNWVNFSTAGNRHVNGGGTTIENGKKSTFTFNAIQNGDGSVNGHLTYHFRLADVSVLMDIDCMEINGNRATLSGIITEVSGNPAYSIILGWRMAFSVKDNGQGKGKDFISDLFVATDCGGDYETYLPITGNITIKE